MEWTQGVPCLQGPMVVEVRRPRDEFELLAGGMCTVAAGRPHRVTGQGGGPCRFGVLQGVGAYDFHPVDRPETEA